MKLTIFTKESLVAILSGVLAIILGCSFWMLLMAFVFDPITGWLSLVLYNINLFYLIFNSFLEESIRLFCIKWFKVSSGILFGFSYGIMEVLFRGDPWRVGYGLSIICHILTTSILIYSIRKKKVFLGFLAVVFLHTLWNYFFTYLI